MNTALTAGALPAATGPGQVYRVGFPPDPWAFTPWEYAEDGRFGGRWDDPHGLYRVLYAASDALGCWLEVLAPFRPDPQVLAELEEIRSSPDDEADPPAAGAVPREFFNARLLGVAQLDGWHVDVGAKEALAPLRQRMAARLVHYGLDLDGGTLRMGSPRELTQEISRVIYEDRVADEPVAGISYESRYGNDVELWAILEREHVPLARELEYPLLAILWDPEQIYDAPPPVRINDEALRRALRIHQLRVDD